MYELSVMRPLQAFESFVKNRQTNKHATCPGCSSPLVHWICKLKDVYLTNHLENSLCFKVLNIKKVQKIYFIYCTLVNVPVLIYWRFSLFLKRDSHAVLNSFLCASVVVYFVDKRIKCPCKLILLAFQFLLFVGHFISYKFCDMHVSQRSNGQSPLWLPTLNHFSRPSRILFLSLSLSLSLFSVPHCMCTSCSFLLYLNFVVMYALVFDMVCRLHLSFVEYSDFCRNLCSCVIMWMFYLLYVNRIKLYSFPINVFCCINLVVFFVLFFNVLSCV